jgi:uncharacterized membrane protein
MSPSIAPADNAAQGRAAFGVIGVVIGVVYLLYPFLVQWAFAAGYPQVAVVLMALALAGLCAWLPVRRWQWIAVAVAATIILLAFLSAAVMPLVFVPPVAINACLAIAFARTLLPGREPLITRFARFERGRLQPDLVSYTRSLTWLWVVFFIVMALVSSGLAAFGSRTAWVWFTGVGNYLLIAALLAGEYAYRRRRFTQYPHLPLGKLWGVVRGALRREAQ